MPETGKNGSEPIALIDLTLPQLAEAAHGLERLEKEYENMSGICATLKGGVFATVKSKLGHGKYRAWLTDNFPRSFKTAERYKRLWDAFAKSDSTVAFGTLKDSLADSLENLRSIQLDLSHPIVARVTEWVKGRGAYQLMLEFAGSPGGDTSAYRKKLSPDEERKQAIERCREESIETFNGVYHALDNERWQFGMKDSELEVAADALRELARKISAWLNEPKAKRNSQLSALNPQLS